MKRSVKFALIISPCLIIAGVLLCLISVPSFIQELKNQNQIIETTTKQISDSTESFRLQGDEGNIRFEIGETFTVSYSNTDKIHHSFNWDNGTLYNYSTDYRKWFEKIFYGFHSPDIVVTLPAGHYKTLELKTISGDISLPAGLTFEKILLDTTSGDIEMIDLQGNWMEIETVSGEIKLAQVLIKKKMELSTVSGDLELIASNAPNMVMTTTSGDIDANLLSGKQFKIKTVSGEIEVPPSTKTEQTCTAETISGDIEIDIIWLDELKKNDYN